MAEAWGADAVTPLAYLAALGTALNDAARGDGSALMELSDSYTGRRVGGTYDERTQEDQKRHDDDRQNREAHSGEKKLDEHGTRLHRKS